VVDGRRTNRRGVVPSDVLNALTEREGGHINLAQPGDAFVPPGCTNRGSPCLPAKTRKSSRYWEGRFNEKNYDVVDEYSPPGSDMQGQKDFLDWYHSVLGDMRVTFDQLIAEDELWWCTAPPQGEPCG
jgi:hypothetical protein